MSKEPDESGANGHLTEPEVVTHDSRQLDRHLFGGIAWTAVFRWAAQVVSWAITLYVARILSPDDYGLVAMAMIPIGLARLIEDLGLDAIIVQDRLLAHEQIAELGGLALIVGVCLTLIFLLLAVPIGSFFGESTVTGLIAVLSVTFIADALQILPRALLQRDLAFRRLAWINALQLTFTALSLGIFATLGLRYWSLALNTVTGAVLITAVLWWLRPHPLRWPRSLRKLMQSMKSGGHLILSRMAWYGYSNVDQTIIGKMLGKTDLGAYSFAMTFAALPVQEVTSLVGKVVPGIFSTVQYELPKLQRYFLLLTEAVSYLTLPMSIGLALVADDFVRVALGPQWEAVITPLRLLCVYMAMNASQSLFSHVYLWTGNFRINMLLNLLSLLVLPAAFYLGARGGLIGVSFAWIVAFPLTLLPNFYFLSRIMQMSMWRWLLALVPALVSCAMMTLAVLACRFLLGADLPNWLRLAVQSGAGALVYVVCLYVFFRQRVFGILQVIRGRETAS